jgi:hypothetical protein
VTVWDCRLSTAALGLLYYPRCEPVSRQDRLGLTPSLTIRALWPSPETSLEQQGERNENLVSSSPWHFKSSFTFRKILRHGTFRLYFPSERKVCCWFLSPLKIHRLGRVRTRNLWVQWHTNHYTTKATYTMRCRGPFSGAKAQPGREPDKSPPSSAESRMNRNYTSSPPKRPRGV